MPPKSNQNHKGPKPKQTQQQGNLFESSAGLVEVGKVEKNKGKFAFETKNQPQDESQKQLTFQPFSELDQWQNKALEGLINLFPESENQPKTRLEMVQFAGNALIQKKETESNASAQDQDQFNIYREWCYERDLSKIVTKTDPNERPAIFTKRLLGTTSQYDLKKDYSMKFREELNKHTSSELETVSNGLSKLLFDAQQSQHGNGKNLIEIFEILLLELYDKACLEPKFVKMYAKLVCNISQDDYYIRSKKRCGVDLKKFKDLVIEAYKEVNPNLKHGHTIAELIKQILTRDAISNEIKDGKSQMDKYQEKPGESERDAAIRKQNIAVHLRGCIDFCGQFYQDNIRLKSMLLSDFVFCRLVVFILRVQADEIAQQLNYPKERCEEIHKLNDINLLSEAINVLIKEANNTKMQLEVQYLSCLERMLETAYPCWVKKVEETLKKQPRDEKEITTYLEMKDTMEKIKNSLLAFNEEIIPSYLYFKLRERVFKEKAVPIKEIQPIQTQQTTRDYTQISFEAIEDEWVETNLKSVLGKMLDGEQLTLEAISNTPRIIQFFMFILKANRHSKLLISQLQMLLRNQKLEARTQFLSQLTVDFFHLLAELAVQDDRYWDVFKFIASQFQEGLKFFDITNQLPPNSNESAFFVTNIVNATVHNSFEQTLADQYENLLSKKTVMEAKHLIQTHQYYKFTLMSELQKQFELEKSGYFAEVDSKPFWDELMTPFDEEAVIALKILFQTSLSTQDFRSRLSEFCKLLPGEKAATKLLELFESIGFKCGFQAISILKPNQENFSPERKMRSFLLEYTIKQYAEKRSIDELRTYINQYDQISICLLEKTMAYFKDKPSEMVDLIRICEGHFDKKAMKDNIIKKEADQKSWGLLKEVVNYGKKL